MKSSTLQAIVRKRSIEVRDVQTLPWRHKKIFCQTQRKICKGLEIIEPFIADDEKGRGKIMKQEFHLKDRTLWVLEKPDNTRDALKSNVLSHISQSSAQVLSVRMIWDNGTKVCKNSRKFMAIYYRSRLSIEIGSFHLPRILKLLCSKCASFGTNTSRKKKKERQKFTEL